MYKATTMAEIKRMKPITLTSLFFDKLKGNWFSESLKDDLHDNVNYW